MDAIERRSVFALALVYLFRMLGLFLIMPVISIASDGLQGADAALIGTAIGIYGLTQAMLQIPMGMLSDRLGRKPIIIGGLLLFALGSVICANATDIYALIMGRAVQGAGAIASTLMALLSDVTKEQNRTKAMASVGISIGISFMISLVVGPVLFEMVGLNGLFYVSFLLSLVGLGLILFVVPTPKRAVFRSDTTPNLRVLSLVLTSASLRFLNVSVLLLHATLTAVFVAIPSVLLTKFNLELGQHSLLYLVVMGLAFIGMLPLVIAAEAKGRMKQVLLISVGLIAATIGLFSVTTSLWVFAALICVFFVAFNTLEATLPSLVSKQAPVGYRGTAMGAFSTHQFFGAFIGGVGGGSIVGQYSISTLFLTVACLWVVWTLVTYLQPAPRQLTSMAFTLPADEALDIQSLTETLAGIQGVEDLQIFVEERTAYLKVDKKQLDKAALAAVAPALAL